MNAPTMKAQRGQALILGLFFLIVGTGMLYFMFNTGQMTREKTALTNAADAAAYSGGAFQARALNFLAYTNRAEVANTVAIAQMTALLSWNQYTEQIAIANSYATPDPAGLCVQFCVTAAGQTNLIAAYAGSEILKIWGVDIFGYYLEYFVPYFDYFIGYGLVPTTDAVAIRTLLMPAAATMWASVPLARNELIETVVRQNYEHFGDADAVVALVTDDSWLTHAGGGPAVELWDGDDRERMGDLAQRAADRDPFVKGRNWTREALIPCVGATGIKYHKFKRGGGTYLNDLEEWEAVDTSSWHKRQGGKCDSREYTLGYGSSSVGGDESIEGDDDEFGNADSNDDGFDNSSDNAATYTYTGIPSFFELRQSVLDEQYPELKFGVRVKRISEDLRVSNGSAQNQLHADARINFMGEPESRDMMAIAAAELIFERPRDANGNQTREEYASLFNPFWHVRLAQPSDASLAAVQALQ